MIKILKYYILATSLIVISCYSSDDNYKYDNEATFSIEGIEDSYSLITNSDVLKIKPDVNILNPSDNVSYTWTKFQYFAGLTTTPTDIKVDTISTNIDLEYTIDDAPGNYSIMLQAMNYTTGQILYFHTKLSVRNKYSKGFYVLKEIDGNTDIDLYYDENTTYHDILLNENGERLYGKPRCISNYLECEYVDIVDGEAIGVETNALAVLTDKSLRIIDINGIKYIKDESTIFADANVVDEEPLYFTSYDGGYYATGITYISNNNQYYTDRSNVVYYNAPNESYNFAHHIIAYDKYSFMYDLEQKRFCFSYGGGLTFYDDLYEELLETDTPLTEYKPNNMPVGDMLMYGYNKIGNNDVYGYAMFNKDDGSNSLMLYTIDLFTQKLNQYAGVMQTVVQEMNPIESVREISGQNINNASCFAMNEILTKSIYFAVGNQLYSYKIDEYTEESHELQDFEGETISFIKNYWWNAEENEDDNFNYLAIGTQKDNKYKIYMYELVGSIPVGKPVVVIEGEGEVKKIQYSSSSTIKYAFYSFSRSL